VFLFADDTVFITNNMQKFQRYLNDFNDYWEKIEEISLHTKLGYNFMYNSEYLFVDSDNTNYIVIYGGWFGTLVCVVLALATTGHSAKRRVVGLSSCPKSATIT
jgi:hypothetical protein